MRKQEIAFRKFIIEKKLDNMNLSPGQKEGFINEFLDGLNELEPPLYEITIEQLKIAFSKVQ